MALRATETIKLAKVIIVDDKVWAMAEIFSPSMDYTKTVFPRLLLVLCQEAANFVEEMKR